MALPIEHVVEHYLNDLSVRGGDRSVPDARKQIARVLQGIGARTVGDLTPMAVVKWRKKRAVGRAAKTVNTDLSPVRAALRDAVRAGIIPVNPLASLRSLPCSKESHQRRTPRPPTEEEAVRIIAAAREIDVETSAGPNGGKIPRAIVFEALMATGMRWGEMAQIRWQDFDQQRHRLFVRAVTAKTGRSRPLPLPRELSERIAALRPLHATVLGREIQESDPVFLTPKGRSWGAAKSNMHPHLGRVLKQAGIPKIDAQGRTLCIHGFRHGFATRLAEMGLPVAHAQALTGHRSAVLLLQTYTHLDQEKAVAAYSRLIEKGSIGAPGV